MCTLLMSFWPMTLIAVTQAIDSCKGSRYTHFNKNTSAINNNSVISTSVTHKHTHTYTHTHLVHAHSHSLCILTHSFTLTYTLTCRTATRTHIYILTHFINAHPSGCYLRCCQDVKLQQPTIFTHNHSHTLCTYTHIPTHTFTHTLDSLTQYFHTRTHTKYLHTRPLIHTLCTFTHMLAHTLTHCDASLHIYAHSALT